MVNIGRFLEIAIGAEYIFVFLQNIEYIDALYRLLPIRYLIVIYLGCLWPLVESRQKYILSALACVSGLLIYVDLYVIDNVSIANALWEGKYSTFVLEWISLVYCMLCDFAYSVFGKIKIYRFFEASR